MFNQFEGISIADQKIIITMYLKKDVHGWIFLACAIMYGSPVWSLDHGQLHNQHLKVAVVPWGAFLSWKCPGDADWSEDYFEECPNEEERVVLLLNLAPNISKA